MKYLTLDEANTYFSYRLQTHSWEVADDALKAKALTMAEKVIERLSFKGLQNTQGDIFPRDGEETVPERIKDGICEEALSLLDGHTNDRDLADLHVTSSSYAGFSTTVNENVERPWILCGLTSSIAWQCLAPYLIDRRTFTITRA